MKTMAFSTCKKARLFRRALANQAFAKAFTKKQCPLCNMALTNCSLLHTRAKRLAVIF
ncbi:hypothetical protein [Cellvibrio polysaccharolyticus]|uniref:hypothetical protein n=1 Tax=Cellvibrio polysaccharolyticus TaxID=2082724 RepID=UPI00187EDAF8|nr:hypothetical protein [Cellvibrio polysaccharolyticus]